MVAVCVVSVVTTSGAVGKENNAIKRNDDDDKVTMPW